MTMKKAIRVFLWVGIAALSMVPWAIAQNVTLTSAGNNVYDGIYVSPYYATVNGAPNTPIVCDDFGDESKLPSNWSATVVSFSAISPTDTSWGLAGGTLTQYNAVLTLLCRSCSRRRVRQAKSSILSRTGRCLIRLAWRVT